MLFIPELPIGETVNVVSLLPTPPHLAEPSTGSEIDIANDCRKLLSLAIAFRSKLRQTPGGRPSSDVVRKGQEIKKLAHAVKDRMIISSEAEF